MKKMQMLTTIVVLKVRQISFEHETVTFEVQTVLEDKMWYKIAALGDFTALNSENVNYEGHIVDFDFHGEAPHGIMQGVVPVQNHIFQFEKYAAQLENKNVAFVVNETLLRIKKMGIRASDVTGLVTFSTLKKSENHSFVMNEKR